MVGTNGGVRWALAEAAAGWVVVAGTDAGKGAGTDAGTEFGTDIGAVGCAALGLPPHEASAVAPTIRPAATRASMRTRSPTRSVRKQVVATIVRCFHTAPTAGHRCP